jgi:hypothetical protein
MSEKLPNPENREKDLREQAVEALKIGAENAQEAFLQWRLAREKEVEILGTERASIRLLIESAAIFGEARMLEEAWENLQDARVYASQMKDAQLLDEIEKKIDELEGGEEE